MQENRGTIMSSWRKAAITLIVAILPALTVWGKSPAQLGRELLGATSDKKVDVIVQFTARPTLRRYAKMTAVSGRCKTDSSGAIKGPIPAPGDDPLVITVGAMHDNLAIWRPDDVMTSYSSKGPSRMDQVVKPDVVAPGNRITSLANSIAIHDSTRGRVTVTSRLSPSLLSVVWGS